MRTPSNLNQEVLNRILDRFFKNQPIVYNQSLEGQDIDNKGFVELGPWAGPEASIENLLHEMSHFVEINTRRMCKYGWGLKFGKSWSLLGQSGFEFDTDQSVQREIRVWAIQSNLIEHFEGSVDVADLVSSATYLSAFCYYAKHLKHDEEKKLNQITIDVQNLRSQYPVEWFETEWFRRMKLISKRKKKLTSQVA